MHLKIEHTTRYRYASPSWDSFNELRLRPADDYRQTMLAFDLEIDPKPVLRSQLDRHGNAMHHFLLAEEHQELSITARSRVMTHEIPKPVPIGADVLPELRHRFFEILAPTSRVPLARNWFSAFGAIPLRPEDELVGWLGALNEYLHGRFMYRSDATHVNTPLDEFAAAGEGVCQDFAHAMLGLLRQAEVPARYVSGYVHAAPWGDERMIGAEGSHAWVEAFLPGSGWVGFDPTNGCMVTEAHVKIATGRDYDDVPPVRGLRRGGDHGDLEVEVAVRHAEGAPVLSTPS